MKVFLFLPVVLPILAAGVSTASLGWVWLQRVIGLAVLTVSLVSALAILITVEADGPQSVQAGDWPAPFGITIVADLFAAIMLVVSVAMLLAVLVYAIGQKTDTTSRVFHPVYLLLAAGVSLAFLTGDLFNLFVSFEVMLIASYVLITLGGNREQVRSGMTYIVINLIASALFVTAIAFVYAATGTVNMADLVGKLDTIPGGLATALGLLLLVVFGIKAAIFPLFFWLPDSYPTAPSPITAVFAGLLTKVGVYAIIRSQTLLFPHDGPDPLLLAIAALTMLVGVLGAIAQNDIKRILSFHIVSQIGYMILGLAFFTIAGLAGAILYIVHHIIVKTSLFLVGGMVEETENTGALSRLGGLTRRAPLLAVLFLIPALSLAGVPPFSGFVAKLSIAQAGFAVDSYFVVGVSLLVGLLTLYSMTKIWNGAFWGTPPDDAPEKPAPTPALMAAATGAVVAMSLAVALFAGPLYDLTEQAARELADPGVYVGAVLR
ncbi:MAG: Na+/H+ antiporter subunit D [Acidimicrobiia bacterium]|nr:Na+/H+ antiporter subunit D [Acidimicrobiia bacterium]